MGVCERASYRGERGHLVITQREVEYVQVVGVVAAPVARGDGDHPLLRHPPQRHLLISKG